jgi:hypothetical protein
MAVEVVAAEILMPLLAIPHQQVADAVAAEQLTRPHVTTSRRVACV